MLKKLLNKVNISLSRPKEYEMDLTTYYPLEIGVSTEFEGVYTSEQETFSFTCLLQNIDISPVNGQLTAMQYKSFITENNDIIYEQVRYVANNESQVVEFAVVTNGEYEIHSEGRLYIDTYVKKESNNDVFEFKTFEKITFNEVETYCFVVRKEFYSGKTHLRTEKLYLVDGVGLIRYEEKNYANKVEIYYQISEKETGYQVLKSKSFVYCLYNPMEKIIIGNLPNSSRTNFKVIMTEEENDPNELLLKAEALFRIIENSSKEKEFRLQLASILATEFNRTEDIDEFNTELIVNSISLDNVFFYNGVMELFYKDGGLFNDQPIYVAFDYTGSIVNIDLRSY
jgi:hypothetical protein